MKYTVLVLLALHFPGFQAGYAQNQSLTQGITAEGSYHHPGFGENVFLFDPGMDMSQVQAIIDTISDRQTGRDGEFSRDRYALLFKPGLYELDIRVGYYMQVMGLGESPEDVVIRGAVRSNSRRAGGGHVLTNFWRSVENLTIIPDPDSINT
ncbi:MAG TPA: hypothetical protein ENO20_05175 [Bacteroides sp.]|nr:hypothetical protein [Bacteroides sp.]